MSETTVDAHTSATVVFLKGLTKSTRTNGVSIHSLLTLELLHSRYRDIAKVLKECMAKRLFLDRFFLKASQEISVFGKIEACILRGCSSFLRTTEVHEDLLGVCIDLLKVLTKDGRHGLFTRNKVRNMLEGKEYRNLIQCSHM